jgi:O-antigen/teichoic acid export membrane protein
LPRIFGLTDAAVRTSVVAASRDALYRLLAPMMLGLALGTPILLLLWAPASFQPRDLVLLSCVVVVTAVPYAAVLSLTRSLLALGRSRVVAAAGLLAALANVGINLLLIPRLDLLGAAVGTFLAFGLMQVILLLASRGRAAVPRPATPVAVLLVVSSALVLLLALLPSTLPYLVVRGVAVLACLLWFGLVGARLAGWRSTRTSSR